MASQSRQHQGKHPLKALTIQALPDDRHTRMVRRHLLERVAEKAPQRERILTAQGDLPLAPDALEETNHQHLKVNDGINAGPPAAFLLRISRRTDLPDFLGEAHRL